MTTILSAIASRRRLLRIVGAVAAIVLVTAIFSHLFYDELAPESLKKFTSSGNDGREKYDVQRMHLLIPATSTNYHLCQLLTSTALMGFAAPVLINWDAPEAADAYVQHLMKVEGVLNYLDSLREDQQDDLVFMLDGFDAWFQLPGDVMIQRYYDVIDRAAQQHLKDFGADLVKKHDIRDTVLFGSDKLCWPLGDERPACWAVPESWMDPLSFGPDTDHGIIDHRRARWLNSGTAMGPAKEMRDVFKATLDKIHDHHTTDSDQFYFAEVWADQSYQRRLNKLERDREAGKDVSADEAFLLPPQDKDIPDLKPGQRTEYYLGLDFDSAIWQTIAFYDDYVAWVQQNYSSSYVREASKTINPYHHFVLPEDLTSRSARANPHGLAQSPLEALDRRGDAASESLLRDARLPAELRSWETLPLAFNTISKTVPPVIHFTGKKGYRDMWWPRNWYYPYQAELLAALRRRGPRTDGPRRDAVAGAWTYAGNGTTLGWKAWGDGLCGQFEAKLQGKERVEL
ncbi:hypothetical protein DL766_010336 [Monosporascus sp. MC13-8B]|uniref:Nucleotide-diphospho-sugar transferase domain-containing protein n=1 Tax=Monosporascus cannonballus TaxID=155416 RepID=A0ABY0GWJ2_9PEZI|nr:hypothetical protein DL762_009800 [Monosporascus cannonballus]RYO79077.1 hypothetical protein DL763_009418 [Monosporascus cannonballus]RYP02509.1 hypothetical protein DL766_010336 [Monosporascus sp. MC13-8B]